MSKSRIMGAASSGYNYGANKNSPGNGNGKWQGLWPSVGHARNARYINTRAGGDNRNVIFCINQLGGVGRKSNMFATTADGVKDCKSGTGNSLTKLQKYIASIKFLLNALFPNILLGSTLVIVGENETFKNDMLNNCNNTDVSDISNTKQIIHFDSSTTNTMLNNAATKSTEIYEAVKLLVSLISYVNKEIYESGISTVGFTKCNSKWLGIHTLGLMSDKAFLTLLVNGYGNRVWKPAQLHFFGSDDVDLKKVCSSQIATYVDYAYGVFSYLNPFGGDDASFGSENDNKNNLCNKVAEMYNNPEVWAENVCTETVVEGQNKATEQAIETAAEGVGGPEGAEAGAGAEAGSALAKGLSTSGVSYIDNSKLEEAYEKNAEKICKQVVDGESAYQAVSGWADSVSNDVTTVSNVVAKGVDTVVKGVESAVNDVGDFLGL